MGENKPLTPEQFARKAGISVAEAQKIIKTNRKRAQEPGPGSAFQKPSTPADDLHPTKRPTSTSSEERPTGTLGNSFKPAAASGGKCSELEELRNNGTGLSQRNSHYYEQHCMAP